MTHSSRADLDDLRDVVAVTEERVIQPKSAIRVRDASAAGMLSVTLRYSRSAAAGVRDDDRTAFRGRCGNRLAAACGKHQAGRPGSACGGSRPSWSMLIGR
jgi:hypothetical protein